MSIEANRPLPRTSVLVVGSGPAGLAASLLLQQYGVPALTITRYGWTANTPRAHHINPRTMELLRGLGLEDAVHRTAMRMDDNRNVIWCVSLAGDEIGRLGTYHDGGPGGYVGLTPCDAANIPQNHFEPLLADAFMGRGGKLLFNTECLEVRQSDSGVLARVRNRVTDETFWIEADYLIGADGANSIVADQMGLEFEGKVGWGAAVNVWIRADLERFCAHRPAGMYWTNLPGSDFWVGSGLFVTVKAWNEFFVSFMYDPATGDPDLSPETLRRKIHGIIGDTSVNIDILHVGKWLMNAQVARSYTKGRVFCMGDAVHRHSPASGLGLNVSTLDAYNLAWKLKLVLSGVAAPSLLDTYDAERQPIGREVIRRSMDSVRENGAVPVALGYRPGLTLEQREAVLREFRAPTENGAGARDRVAAAIYQLRYCYSALGIEMGYRYASSAVIARGESYVPSPDPDLVYVPQTVPGYPLAHAVLSGSPPERRLLSTIDLVAGGGFTLLTGPGGEVWNAICVDIAKRTGLEIKAISIGPGCMFDDPYGEWRRIRGVGDRGAVLVRPDAHVAWRASTASEEEFQGLSAAITSILGKG